MDIEELFSVGSKPSSSSSTKLSEFDQMLAEIGHLDANAFAGHLIENVTDEVALEGLDGITIQALKVRLEYRRNFSVEGFEDIGPALWNQIRRSKHFSFYLLPTARPDLIPYSWDDYRDDRGNAFEPLHSPEEIYTYFPVEDKEKGIRGSCEHYETRKDVSFIVRRISYLDTIRLFGNKLVVVASQPLREKTLLGANYKKYEGLTILQYCIMERVGRARYCGEITRGKISSACIKVPPKNQFYQRKLLQKEKLILRQNASVKFVACKCPAIVSVFHLPRFYRRVETSSSLNIRIIFTNLNKSDIKAIPVEEIVAKYGKHTLRGILSQFPTLLETAWHQTSETNAAAYEDPEFKSRPRCRTVRVLRLKVTDVEVQNQVIRKVLDGQPGDDEDGAGNTEQDDGEEKVNLTNANSYSCVEVLRPPHHFLTTTDTYFIYRLLFRAGTMGLILTDFHCFYMTQLEARSACRSLTRNNACKEGVIKLHKQKAFTYTITQFAENADKIHISLRGKHIEALAELTRIREAVQAKNTKKSEDAAVESTISSVVQAANLQIEDVKPALPDKSKRSPAKPKSPTKKTTSPVKSKSEKSKKVAPPQLESIPIEAPMEPPRIIKPSSPKRIPRLCLVQPTEEMEEPIMSTVGETTFLLPDPLLEESETQHNNPTSGRSTRILMPRSEIAFTSSSSHADEELIDYESDKEFPSEYGFSRKGDLVDEEILARMNRQRVDWNEHDDRFILLAYIASALFIPKCNFTKIFIFNSVQIRDLLLKKTKGEATKTSAAIRRRIHFLINRKAYFDGYIGLMGAAIRDEVLYETLIKPHLHPPQLRIYIYPPFEALEAAVDYLYKKFDDPEFIYTDTRSSIKELETILFLRQLKRNEFYWKAVKFVIFCRLGKMCSDRTAFMRMWRRHVSPGGETGSVVDDVTDTVEGVEDITELNRELEEVDDDKKTPEEHHIDYSFKFLRFVAKQLQIIFNNMLMLSTADNRKGFQLLYFDPALIMSSSVGVGPNICHSKRECTSDQEIKLWNARCLILEYVFCGDSSKALEKSVVQMTRLPLEKAADMLTSAKVLVPSKKSGLLCISRSNLRQLIMGLPSSAFDETLDFLNYIDEASNVDSLACISMGILFTIVELSDFFKSSINMIESVFTLNDEWIPVYDGISQERESRSQKGKKRKASGAGLQESLDPSASHYKRQRLTEEEEEDIGEIFECFEDIERDMLIRGQGKNVGLEEGENYMSSSTNALRLLRIRLNQAGVHMPRKQFTGFVEKDFFTINLPSLEFILPKRIGLNHKIAKSSHPFAEDEMKELRSHLVELVYHKVLVLNDSPINTQVLHYETLLKKYAVLFELINLAGNVGVSGAFLKSKFEKKSLVRGLRYLLDSRLIFSIGVVQRRFVSFNNVNDWIIPIRPAVNAQVIGHVIIRPWITSLGAISWPTVSRLLTSLLGQLQKPEVPFDELCEALSPTLSPVEVLVLVEAFAKLNYLTVYKLHDSAEVNIFSKHPTTKCDIEYNADTLVDTEGVYVAVSPYTTFLHAQLKHATQKASKKGFTDEKHHGVRNLLKPKRNKKQRHEETT